MLIKIQKLRTTSRLSDESFEENTEEEKASNSSQLNDMGLIEMLRMRKARKVAKHLRRRPGLGKGRALLKLLEGLLLSFAGGSMFMQRFVIVFR